MTITNLHPDRMEVRPLASMAEVMVSNVDKLSKDDELPVRLCNYTDVYKNAEVHPGLDLMEATATKGEIARFRLRVGDTVFTKDSETADDIGVPAYVTGTAEDFVCGYHLAIARPDPARVHPKYLYWWLASREAAEQWANRAAGVTRVGLRQPDIRGFPLTIHRQIFEQRAIADFLDRETAQIDAMIEAQRELVTALEERRLSTINETIDGARGAKRTPLGATVRIQTGITLGKTYDHGAELAEFPYLRVANVQTGYVDISNLATIMLPPSEARKATLRDGDVLITEGGDRAALARGSLWHAQVAPCLHQNHIYALRPKQGLLLAPYLVYVLEGSAARMYFESTRRQTTNLSATNSDLVRRFRFTLPSVEDQASLVDELDTSVGRIDAMIDAANESIALMQERRAALISAAVTGRIDPRTGREYPKETP